ncbi:hypothetical protein S2091_4730 [Solimicrobium silvestre]|uniref:Transmembrane protein n=1 Tax=Solimicrobium silvestre TaxID=2099400 RepID=A0A2S9GS65_9BURK|nr:hypothetical protein S2091_4730 [Solimicrobium silvestre]
MDANLEECKLDWIIAFFTCWFGMLYAAGSILSILMAYLICYPLGTSQILKKVGNAPKFVRYALAVCFITAGVILLYFAYGSTVFQYYFNMEKYPVELIQDR